MTIARLCLLFIVSVSLNACSMHRGPDSHAQRFFDKGERHIVKALKAEDASEAVVANAKAIMAKHEPEVVPKIATYLRERRALMLAVTSGKETNVLLDGERKTQASHEAALRSIGAMHAALAEGVGAPTWAAASRRMEGKMARYFKD